MIQYPKSVQIEELVSDLKTRTESFHTKFENDILSSQELRQKFLATMNSPTDTKQDYSNGQANGVTKNHVTQVHETAGDQQQVKSNIREEIGLRKIQDSQGDNCPYDQSIAWKLSGKSYLNGPDQILPSTAVSTSIEDGAVRITGIGEKQVKWTPVSVPSLLVQATERAPDRTALSIKIDGEWQTWTYREHLRDVRTVAKAFIALGLERFHAVCIIGYNSPWWFQSDLAAIFAGGFATGIYTTNSPEACAYCALDSRANIFVVEDEQQLAKVLEIRDQLPDLKAIIQYKGQPSEHGVLSWSELLLLGNSQPDSILEERLSQISINQCCTLIYTSGTTGKPKGVMLTHDTLTFLAHVNSERCGFRDCKEHYVSYLPLSHVAAQMGDLYCTMFCSATVYFGDKNALKGSLIDTLKEVRPTKLLAVPRVWEKIYEKMQEIGQRTTGIKRMIATWAKSRGLEHNLNRMHGIVNAGSFEFQMANKIVLSKVKEALGLSRCTLHLSGAAPISQEILKYFLSLNICVTEAYGMSECGGPHAMAVKSAFRLGSCGKALSGCYTKIGNWDEDGNGEIMLGGRHICMGYLRQPELTQEAIDSEGWLHTGDMGYVDKDGFVFITGRFKDLLITAGGENVAPAKIEETVKSELPIVSHAILLGDRRKFISLLITLKVEVDLDTQVPSINLLQSVKDWIKLNGDCQVNTVQDVLEQLYTNKNEKLIQAIQSDIDKVNTKAVSYAQQIKKWQLLPEDFSIPGGELGPTLKLKRSVVYDKYQDTIENVVYKC